MYLLAGSDRNQDDVEGPSVWIDCKNVRLSENKWS